MIKALLILILLMMDFIIVNQFLIPALGCGSTLGEGLAFLALPILGGATYTIIIKILNYKK
jgi:hypothetical protein